METTEEARGKRIQEARVSQGVSRKVLAAAAKISQSHLSSIERAKRGCSRRVLKAICDRLDVTPSALGFTPEAEAQLQLKKPYTTIIRRKSEMTPDENEVFALTAKLLELIQGEPRRAAQALRLAIRILDLFIGG